MKKLILAGLLLCASLAAHAQGSTLPFPPLQGPNGINIPFAHLTFCTFPATFDSLGNCTNTITVFQDIGLTIPYGSAIITDGTGTFPPNQVTTTALWFAPANNLCYTATGANILHTVNVCTPFSVSIVPGSSPSYATVTITASGKFTETAAPTCVIGFDFLWGDSTAHRLKECDNNGTPTTIAQFADNLSVFSATTSAQLAGVISDETGSGPLVFANGGTIAPTSVTTGQIIQPAATALTIKDNQGGTRFSIPSGGVAQGTINNTLITGGSTYGGTTLHVQTFTSNGTFTIPANITSLDVILLGGGGAGGGSTAANNGGGGGAGGYAEKVLSVLTPGNTITVTVGGGGAGSAGANGGAGTASSIASGTQTIATVTANGGSGGQSQAGSVATPGLGGVISTGGDINGFGVNGYFSTAGTIGGAGGSTFLGGGGLGGPNSTGSVAGTNTGSGGGGAGGPGSSSAGGNGAAGIVIFRWVN